MTGGAIRKMTEGDIPEILELETRCFPVPWTENMFLCQIGLEDASACLVHEVNGKITGYIIAWFGFEEAHILSIGVDSDSRGGGIADALLEEVLEISMGQGCVKVLLEVRDGNLRARKFYEKQGFSQVGVRKGYYSESGEDALILEKEIV
ncbi:MAG: ribosomal protein S18-alanine N-acetyltransferase [Candidatus Krumholzibacteria bacterium]|nr:ribosomal protein S18-alanine N-acetyltransferase [Candidatus Krumholzibacteria bacterium]